MKQILFWGGLLYLSTSQHIHTEISNKIEQDYNESLQTVSSKEITPENRIKEIREKIGSEKEGDQTNVLNLTHDLLFLSNEEVDATLLEIIETNIGSTDLKRQAIAIGMLGLIVDIVLLNDETNYYSTENNFLTKTIQLFTKAAKQLVNNSRIDKKIDSSPLTNPYATLLHSMPLVMKLASEKNLYETKLGEDLVTQLILLIEKNQEIQDIGNKEIIIDIAKHLLESSFSLNNRSLQKKIKTATIALVKNIDLYGDLAEKASQIWNILVETDQGREETKQKAIEQLLDPENFIDLIFNNLWTMLFRKNFPEDYQLALEQAQAGITNSNWVIRIKSLNLLASLISHIKNTQEELPEIYTIAKNAAMKGRYDENPMVQNAAEELYNLSEIKSMITLEERQRALEEARLKTKETKKEADKKKNIQNEPQKNNQPWYESYKKSLLAIGAIAPLLYAGYKIYQKKP